ncbi:MAG: succinate dehydrogenase/fumarate reductase iron-sulfur subunit [Bacteroidales bacterium]|nr:succinate dehydrogenase/fumarate reductase iron-sulfur subunit [Bacteroidales bacterium]
MKVQLKIWRQPNAQTKGQFVDYSLNDINPEMSFLEMLDALNKQLIEKGEDPVAYEHDCREGICGSCGLFINGRPHGPEKEVATCQLHMRSFRDGQTIVVEPWRAQAFPVIKDLIVDRSAFEKIMDAGGFVSVDTGSAPEANSTPVKRQHAERAFDAGVCIGCGACVAACKNSSATLFVAAKISQLALLPQGKPEAKRRALNMVAKMEELGFGSCTSTEACEVECPKSISLDHIARMNREYLKASFSEEKD